MGSFLSILHPGFTWPRPMRSCISTITPSTPRYPGLLERRLYGLLHKGLIHFSIWYTHWWGIDVAGPIYRLPFGLLVKWSERTSLEEAAAMKMARAAGMPVPLVLSCGEHHNDIFDGSYSILMTALPGDEIMDAPVPFDMKSEGPWVQELRSCVDAMRQWISPYGQAVCSAYNTQIKSHRVPLHKMGPFTNQAEFHDYMIEHASQLSFASKEEYDQAYRLADSLRSMAHHIVFTHGDFKVHNVLVDENDHLSGFLDWETAGWHPEYFEFTTAMRMSPDNLWWYQLCQWISGDKYGQELECERALNSLTVDSYAGM